MTQSCLIKELGRQIKKLITLEDNIIAHGVSLPDILTKDMLKSKLTFFSDKEATNSKAQLQAAIEILCAMSDLYNDILSSTANTENTKKLFFYTETEHTIHVLYETAKTLLS